VCKHGVLARIVHKHTHTPVQIGAQHRLQKDSLCVSMGFLRASYVAPMSAGPRKDAHMSTALESCNKRDGSPWP